MVVVEDFAEAALTSLHVFLFPTAVHLKEPAEVFRVLPSFLHAVPLIDGACAELGEAATYVCCRASGSGAATGSIPVKAAAPTEIVWHITHIRTTNSTYRTRYCP